MIDKRLVIVVLYSDIKREAIDQRSNTGANLVGRSAYQAMKGANSITVAHISFLNRLIVGS